MSLTLRRILAVIVTLIGGFPLCCGAVVALLLPRAFDQQAAVVARLEPISFAAFEDGTPGREALVEGTLSPRNRISEQGFVAYRRYAAARDSDGDRVWRLAETVTPPLLVELPGGVVRVVGDYTLSSVESLEADSVRVEGLRPGGAVLALGVLVQGAEGLELDASMVSGGSRAAYLEGNRLAAQVFGVFGWVVLSAGLLVFVVGLGLVVWTFNQRPPPQFEP